MKKIIESCKYLSLIAVITLLLTFCLALAWGVAKAFYAWKEILTSFGQSPEISLLLIKLIDAFLIAMVLYMLAASIYKMFIGKLDLPSQLVANDLPGLKSKLSSMIVLVIVVRFVETLFEQNHAAVDILWLALATALVSAVLVAFGYFNSKNEKEE